MKQIVKFLAGPALAALLLVWVFREVDPHALRVQIGQASISGLVLAALLGLAQNVPRAWRWRALLDPVRPGTPLRPMLVAILIGYMVNVLPGRIGELVRPMLLSARARLPLGACLGSVLADRLLDGLTVIVLLAVGLGLAPMKAGMGRFAGWATAGGIAAVVILIGVLLAVHRARASLDRSFRDRGGVVGWIGRTLVAASHGVVAIATPRLIPALLLHSATTWALILVSTWIGVRSCGVEIPLLAMSVLVPLLALGIALPTPAGVGGYQFAMTYGLTQLFGVPVAAATAASVLVHLAVVLPWIVAGGAALAVERIALSDFLAGARQFRQLAGGGADAAEIGGESP